MTMTATETPVITLSPADLIAAVKAVSFAVGKDDTLPVLMTMQFAKEGDTLTLAATDRYRLHVAQFTNPDLAGVPDGAVHVNGKDVTAHIKTLAKALEITLTIADDQLVVNDLVNASTRTFNGATGEFPKWKMLIPEVTKDDGVNMFSVNPAQFAEAMKACQLMSLKNTPAVAAQAAQTIEGMPKPILTWSHSPFDYWTFKALVMPVRLAS